MARPEDALDDIFHPGGRLRLELLTDDAARALEESVRLTRATRWDTVRSPHIFMGLLAAPDEGIRQWCRRLHADEARLLAEFQEMFFLGEGVSDPVLALNREFLSDNALRLLRDALQRASGRTQRLITPLDLLISLLTASNSVVAEC